MQVARSEGSPPRLSPQRGVWAQSIWDRRSVVHCYTRDGRGEYWHRSCGRGFGVLLEHFVEGMAATKPEMGRRGAIRKCSLCDQRVSRGIVSAFEAPLLDAAMPSAAPASAERPTEAHTAAQAA